MNPEERINKHGYLNWIKGTLALMHLCDVVRDYAYHIFDKYLDNIPDRSHYDFEGGRYFTWLSEYTEWKSGEWKFTTNHPCVCQFVFKEILRLHFFGGKSVGFENCKKKHVGGPWGLARFFMPISKYNADIERPDETEVTVILKLIENCLLFSNIDHSKIEKIVESRNEIMHSPTNNVSDDHLKEYIDAMIGFLREALQSNLHIDIQRKLYKAQVEIRELKYADMRVDLRPEKAERAIQFKKKLVTESIKRGCEEGDVVKLSHYLDILEKLGCDLLAWKKQGWETEKLREISSFREQLQEVTAAKCTVKIELTQTKRENEKLKQTLRERQSRFDSETKKIKDELNETKKTLHETEKRKNTFEKDLRDSQYRMNEAIKEIERLNDGLHGIKNMLKKSEVSKSIIHQGHQSTQAGLDATTNEVIHLENELSGTKNKLQEAEISKSTIERKLQETQDRLEAISNENKKFKKLMENIKHAGVKLILFIIPDLYTALYV